MKTVKNEVTISSLTSRNAKLQDKAQLINGYLNNESSKVSIVFIDNKNLYRNHFNLKGIHINFKCLPTTLLMR